VRKNIRDEKGQVAIEYALVILLLVVATVVSLVAINDPAVGFFGDVADAIGALV
jgi:Flp pilus assembly pilin Flp